VGRRQGSRRTGFATVANMGGGEPRQVIDGAPASVLRGVDLSGLGGRADEEALRLAAEDALQPFDLARGPLFRPLLLSLREGDHVFLGSMHHIVSDGWSMGVLVRELGALYGALAAGRPSPRPEPAGPDAGFAGWARR